MNTLICTLSLLSGNAQTPKVTFPDNSYFAYTVNSGVHGGQLASVTNTQGNAMSYAYSQGSTTWTVATTDSNSHTISKTYATSGQLVSENLPATGTESVGPTMYWNYNSSGYLTSTQDARGNTTTLTRDPTTNVVTKITYPDTTWEGFTYNSFEEVVSHTQRNGGVEYFTYNSAGLALTYQDATQNASHLTTFGHDANYRVSSVTNANGYQTTFSYNDFGQQTKLTHPDTTYVTYTYGPKMMTSVTNELGKMTTCNYDGFNRLTSVVDPLTRTTYYSYDPLTPTNPSPIEVTLPSSKITYTHYAPAWAYEVSSVTTGYGTSSAATTSYNYDPVGNLTSIVDPRTYSTGIAYDARNRKHSVTDPASNVTSYTYDDNSNVLTVTAPSGVTTNVYDTMNRLTSSTDPKGRQVQMGYDAGGSMNSYKDPNTCTYTYSFDFKERLLQMTYPDVTTENYTYDWVGNLVTYETRDSKTVTLGYDTRNRNTSAGWNDGITPAVSVGYDAASRLTTLSNSNSALSYGYTDANELTSETENITGLGSKIVTYGFNTDETLGTLTYPDSTALTYSYDPRNNLTAISQGSTQVIGYTYDSTGNVSGKTYGNGVTSTRVYDSDERLTSISDTTPSPTANTLLQRFDYAYDAMSRLKWVQRNSALGDVYAYNTDSEVTSVEYNATNPRNTPTNPSRTVSYTLGVNANRSSVTDSVSGTTSYTVNSDNQYTAVAGSALTYDGKGNLKTYGGWTYTYDAQNRLIQATNGSATLTQAYDPFGRCVQRNASGSITYMVYDLGWNVLCDYSTAGIQTYRYVHGVATEMVSRTDSSNNVVYFQGDNLGNTTKLTGSSGALIEQYSYDIFGAPTIMNTSGTIISTSAYSNRFLFTGREYLIGPNIYDYRARAYSPVLGRFLQPDPIGHAGDAHNIYRYCRNDPVNCLDRCGLSADDILDEGGDYSNANTDTSTYDDPVQDDSAAAYNQASSEYNENGYSSNFPTTFSYDGNNDGAVINLPAVTGYFAPGPSGVDSPSANGNGGMGQSNSTGSGGDGGGSQGPGFLGGGGGGGGGGGNGEGEGGANSPGRGGTPGGIGAGVSSGPTGSPSTLRYTMQYQLEFDYAGYKQLTEIASGGYWGKGIGIGSWWYAFLTNNTFARTGLSAYTVGVYTFSLASPVSYKLVPTGVGIDLSSLPFNWNGGNGSTAEVPVPASSPVGDAGDINTW